MCFRAKGQYECVLTKSARRLEKCLSDPPAGLKQALITDSCNYTENFISKHHFKNMSWMSKSIVLY